MSDAAHLALASTRSRSSLHRRRQQQRDSHSHSHHSPHSHSHSHHSHSHILILATFPYPHQHHHAPPSPSPSPPPQPQPASPHSHNLEHLLRIARHPLLLPLTIPLLVLVIIPLILLVLLVLLALAALCYIPGALAYIPAVLLDRLGEHLALKGIPEGKERDAARERHRRAMAALQEDVERRFYGWLRRPFASEPRPHGASPPQLAAYDDSIYAPAPRSVHVAHGREQRRTLFEPIDNRSLPSN